MSRIEVIYYDGRTPKRHPAWLSQEADVYVVQGDFGELRVARDRAKLSEALAASPRLLSFPDGQMCEIRDLAQFAQWLQAHGHQESLVAQWQQRWHFSLVAVLSTVLVIAATYLWGLPAIARGLAPLVPQLAVQKISETALGWMDEHELLQPTQLSSSRQNQLSEQINTLARAAGIKHKLHFRSSRIGPNAFALPSGDIVLLDELVSLAKSDEEILGVIAHELGHVARRHGMRQLIQSSVVSFAVGVYLGDISSAASGLATMLLQSGYSREFEYEADDYAVALFHRLGRSPEALASMLGRLQASHDASGKAAHESEPVKGWRRLGELFSSHPETGERMARIRAAH